MEDTDFAPRMGTFFWVIGTGALALFIITSQVYQLVIGLVAIFLGIYLRRKVVPPPPSGRFAGLKKLLSGEGKKKKD